MESASADDVRARGSPKGLVLAPLQAQAQHYPKGEGWKRSQFGSRKRSQTDRQTDAPTTTTLIASGPPLRGDPYFVCISTTLLRNKCRATGFGKEKENLCAYQSMLLLTASARGEGKISPCLGLRDCPERGPVELL